MIKQNGTKKVKESRREAKKTRDEELSILDEKASQRANKRYSRAFNDSLPSRGCKQNKGL